MNAGRLIRALLVLLLALTSRVSAQTQHGWPVEPVNQEHPIGNNLGEFWLSATGPYQHTGLDILATPYPGPDAPWVVATVAGEVTYVNDTDTTGWGNFVRVRDATGIEYRYVHLAYGSFAASLMGTLLPGTAVKAGDLIARAAPWGSCVTYSHVHYDLQDSSKYLDPLVNMVPNPDDFPPEILDIRFADRDPPRWNEFVPVAENACAVVNGNVDVIARLHDQDDAGTSPAVVGTGNVGVYDLRWRVCAKGAPTCSAWNNTHRFKEMPKTWDRAGNSATPLQFSSTPNWVSTADACSNEVDKNFSVVTGLAPSGWNTSTTPDGSYSVSVEATDFAGNITTRTAHACVQNGPGCATDLSVRDGEDDTGATPYSGALFWFSPDVTVNPGAADENQNVHLGVANVVDVKVWNTGSCTLPVGTAYNVCLGWSPPSGSVPFPLPAGQLIACRSETVTSTPWAPGENRQTTFNWTPPSGTLPQGHSCLVAWSNMSADPVQNSASVLLDNNRAQRNLAFVEAPPPGTMALGPFWIYPLAAVSERSVEISFGSSSTVNPYLEGARLHIPAGMTVTQVADTRIIGGYHGIRPAEVCPYGDEANCISDCNSSAEAAASGCTVVLGRIGPQSRVKLEGVSVTGPTKLLLEVSTRDGVPPGEFFDARIVEYGTVDHSPHTAIGGVTLRFKGPQPR